MSSFHENSHRSEPEILRCSRCGIRFDAHGETLDGGESHLCLECLQRRDMRYVKPLLFVLGAAAFVLTLLLAMHEWSAPMGQ
jgi:hypothetical protein